MKLPIAVRPVRERAEGASAIEGPSPPGARLRVSSSVLRTPFLALGVILVLIGAIDLLPGRDVVAPPAWTRRLPDFDVKYERYRELSRDEGPFDLVVVGSSMAMSGVSPEALSLGMRRRSGRSPRVYNFALQGATNQVVDTLLEVLLADPRPPASLVYVTSPVTLSEFFAGRLGKTVAEEPWFRYRTGRPDLEGWALERWGALRRWNGLTRDDETWWKSRMTIGPRGEKRQSTRAPANEEARRGGDWNPVTPEHTPWPACVEALRSSLSRIGPRRGVVALAPVRSTAGSVGAPLLEAAFERTVRESGLPFLPAPPDALLAPDLYRDLGHLGGTGARVYGRWLGERLAELVSSGRFDVPAGGR